MAGGEAAVGRIEAFEYPPSAHGAVAPAWNGYVDAAPQPEQAQPGAEPASRAEWEIRLLEETRRSFEAGRERGRVEGRDAEREEQSAGRAAAEQQEARRMAGLVESFAAARDRYLHAAEQEVVKLALAVAARILRREAQMDPLLLSGAVRVALGQLSTTTEVKLRVPEAELELWTEAMALVPNLALKPEVVAGEGLRLGDCVVESKLGTVDLGIRAQLAEIERGFFDRAGAGRKEAATEAPAAPPAVGEGRA